MSQAEDLLNSLSENDISTKTEPHIVVGSNRVITVPSELKRIAVQYDHNIETVTFDCPRYWDDHDMSTMKVYINYTRADNEPGCYIADDVAVDETDTSIMHFSWTISRHVTEAVGPLTILVCIKMVDADGNEVNHWNSERNTDMTISQGMECGDIIVNKYPDVITYLRADMGNLADLTTEDKSSLVAAINEAAESGGTADAVTYTPQTLTEEQKSQARTNIGAGQPVFVVNVTEVSGGGGYTADKTAAEIEAAYQAGRTIVCKTQARFLIVDIPVELPLVSRNQERVFIFSADQLMGENAIFTITVNISDSGVEVSTKGVEIYEKPASGIPKTDLADDVQTSLAKADAAISYDSQTLTEEQQAQARTNIGALDVNIETTPVDTNRTFFGVGKNIVYVKNGWLKPCPADADKELAANYANAVLGFGFINLDISVVKGEAKSAFSLYQQGLISDKGTILKNPLDVAQYITWTVGITNNKTYIDYRHVEHNGFYEYCRYFEDDTYSNLRASYSLSNYMSDSEPRGSVSQFRMSAAPTEDMHIATKQYVDTAKTEAQQLGLTSATPGQIIKVKTVQDGKPTEWESVDMDAEKFPKFTKLLTHTITEDELAASPTAFVWGTAQIPNLNDFNVFVLSLVRPDGTKIKFSKWVKLKINSVMLGDICGSTVAESSQYTITANRLFGVWISGGYYDPRNIGVPVLVPPRSSSTRQSDLLDSEPVTSIGFTSYVPDYGLTAGIVVELWGAK